MGGREDGEGPEGVGEVNVGRPEAEGSDMLFCRFEVLLL